MLDIRCAYLTGFHHSDFDGLCEHRRRNEQLLHRVHSPSVLCERSLLSLRPRAAHSQDALLGIASDPAAALTRGLVSGDLTWLMVLWALQLLAISVVALCVASFFMHRRLIK